MAKAKSGPVTMAVAGLGRAGWDIHVSAIRGRKDFVLTEVMDLDESRLAEAEAEFGCCTYRDWGRFLRESRPNWWSSPPSPRTTPACRGRRWRPARTCWSRSPWRRGCATSIA